MAGYSAGSWRATLEYLDAQQDTRREPLLGCSGGVLAGSTGELLWRDTRRDPGELLWDTQGCSGGILGGIHWRDALTEYSAGSTGELLWRDTRRDPSGEPLGGILGGSHCWAALVGYSRDPLASYSGGILGGILASYSGILRAALVGYSAGSTGETL